MDERHRVRASTRSATSPRRCITPLFLVAGTFFPITGLPQWAQTLAWLNPLYHCVELVRSAVFGWEPIANLFSLLTSSASRLCAAGWQSGPCASGSSAEPPYPGAMPEFAYTDLLPLGPDETEYRLLTAEGVSTVEAGGRTFLQVEPEALRLLAYEAMRDIAHLLRPAHLQQLRSILDDPEACPNDRFVALDLLKNANIAAGGVLPMCQDTGTAIVMGKRGQHVLTEGDDEEALSRGIYDAYTRLNLRYSQLAPLTMCEERNTGSNLPAQIELYADTAPGHELTYKFLFMAKGGGSANKSFLFQETKAVLNPASMTRFLDEKLRSLGTAACPPYHLAIVIGGTSAEYALKTVKLASAKYLDTLPTSGSPSRPRLPRPRARGRGAAS